MEDGRARIEVTGSMGSDTGSTATHLLIIRACGAGTDDACVEMRVACTKVPTEEEVGRFCNSAYEAFREWIGEEPVRIGTAILPYCSQQDEEQAEETDKT